jgi:hypothetical protein
MQTERRDRRIQKVRPDDETATVKADFAPFAPGKSSITCYTRRRNARPKEE